MKILIQEVWNATGESKTLAVIETYSSWPNVAVTEWIKNNRPDLTLANGIYSHGFYASEQE